MNEHQYAQQLLASLSHELKTPLATMMLWDQLLQRSPGDSELRDRAIAVIHECALAQQRIVNALYDASRLLAGVLHIEPHRTDLATVLAAAIAHVAEDTRLKQLELASTIDPDIGEIEADRERLRQVIDHLLSNAIKFTEPGGTITLSARRRAGDIVIEVRDTGCGIAAEQLPRLFEPFSPSLELVERHGLGLGLAIAHELVRLHRGSLRADSGGRGQGATFTIMLPAAGGSPIT